MDKRRNLILIMGTDGAGKSTHAQKICKHFAAKGIKCKYVWLRVYHLVSLPLLAYCRLAGLTIYEIKDGQTIGHHEFYRSKFVSTLYPFLLFIDMNIAYLTKIAIPSLLGYSIVCDRFIYDALIDLMIDLNDFDLLKKKKGRIFLRLIPNYAKSLLIDLDEQIIRERRRDLLNDDLMEIKRRQYIKIADEFDIDIFNNYNNIEIVSDSIIKYLFP